MKIKELEDEARQYASPLPLFRVFSIRASGYRGTGVIYAEVKEYKGQKPGPEYARYQAYASYDGSSIGVQQLQSKSKRGGKYNG